METKIGDKAPDFKLPDQDGKVHKLSEYKKKWLLIYFYPADNTPGCTKEACAFRDNYSKLKKELQIVGISRNSVESHKRFSDKYELPFTLLSDPKKDTITKYGADGIIFAKRTSFLIDPKSVIVKIYDKVDPAIHAGQILEDIKNLKKNYTKK